MSAIVVIELTCDRCERTGEHRLADADIASAELFVQRRMAGWNVGPYGRAMCPECVTASGQRARGIVRLNLPNTSVAP